VALGTVNNLRKEISAALAAPVAEATRFAQEQEVATMDETGWRQGNSDGKNPTQRKAWWWVLVTSWVTVFQVHLSRGQASAIEKTHQNLGQKSHTVWGSGSMTP
jgi:transposase